MRPVWCAREPGLLDQQDWQDLHAHLLEHRVDGKDSVDGLLGQANPCVGAIFGGVHATRRSRMMCLVEDRLTLGVEQTLLTHAVEYLLT